jgi:hypothetical protein
MRFLLPATLAVALMLGGCARHYDVYMMGRSSAGQARTTITVNTGHPNGDFTILLHGKQYVGRWIYVAGGGSVTVGMATGVSAGQVAMANGMAISAPTQGDGSVLASAPDGSTLHCRYSFHSWTRSGVGICQDNDGGIFDLQISPS